MDASHTRFILTPDRLAALVMQPGGPPREIAVARAERHLAARQGPAMKALCVLIDTLEAMTASDFPLAEGELPDMRRVASRLVSLALTYDQEMLAQAGMRLCDLIAAFYRDGTLLYRARRTMALYVRVLRLLAPENGLSSVEAALMLAGLDRLAHHSGAVPLR